jgi:hypothetical protein
VNARSEHKAAGFITTLLLLLFMFSAPFVADGRVQPVASVTVTPDTVLVGDRIHCAITVQHAEGEAATLEGVTAAALKPFELISSKRSSSSAPSGIGQDIFELELALFGAGRQPLPPFTVVLRESGGRVTSRVSYKPSSSVYVRELTDASMRDLRPIKPPLTPPIPYLLLMPVLLGAFGVGGVVLLLLFFFKRTVQNSAEKVDFSQVAQRKLRKLGSSLSAGMPPHECYEELSNIMRSFLETHYRISALEAVTQEIERDLKKLGVAGFESIMNLLKQADLVKFADSRPDVEESRQSLDKASEVIRSTRKSRPPVE